MRQHADGQAEDITCFSIVVGHNFNLSYVIYWHLSVLNSRLCEPDCSKIRTFGFQISDSRVNKGCL